MKITKLTILFVLALFTAPFAFYYITFSDMSILKDNSAWGSFGSYLSGSFSVVIAILTLSSLFVLLHTLKETIKSNQNQIIISQHESELNNFNFITSLIIKYINKNSLIGSSPDQNHIFMTANSIMQLNYNFVYYYNHSDTEDRLFYNADDHYKLNVNRFIYELYNKPPRNEDIIIYTRLYLSMVGYDILDPIYPLIKSLCNKILKCTDSDQRELLESILYASIDNNIIYWSLVLINDPKFDEFMSPPKEITEELDVRKSVAEVSQ